MERVTDTEHKQHTFSYQKSEPGRWAVGYFADDGGWERESEWNTSEEAAERAHWLNGGVTSKTDDDEAVTTAGQN